MHHMSEDSVMLERTTRSYLALGQSLEVRINLRLATCVNGDIMGG